MSVVNKMLQDLEARQVNSNTNSADYQPPAKSIRWLTWLVSLSAVVLLVLLYWLYVERPTHRPAINKNSAATQATPEQTNSSAKVMRAADTPAALLKPASAAPANEPATASAADLVSPAVEAQALTENWADASQTSAPTLAAALAEPEAEKVAPQNQQNMSAFAIKDSSQASQARSLKQQISDALASNNNERAMVLLRELLEQQPSNYEALKKLASLLFANGQINQASSRLLAGVQAAPERSDLRLMLARLYIQQQQADLALLLMQELNTTVLPIDYLAFRANLAQQQADYASAHRDYLRLTQMDESNARWWLGLAIIEEKREGDVNVALRAYQRAQNLAQLEPAVTDFITQRIQLLTGTP